MAQPLQSLPPAVADRIPGELQDRIIDHLHDDLTALLLCSTISHSWLRASRYHFPYLEVCPQDSTELYKLLKSSRATLGASTRRLAIRDDISMYPRGFSSLLPAIKSLLLSARSPSCMTSDEFFSWTRHYTHQLVDLVLYGVSCDSLAKFAEGLREFGVLRHLALVDVVWQSSDISTEKITTGTQLLPSLRSLVLGPESSPLILWLLARNVLSIQRLGLRLPNDWNSGINTQTRLDISQSYSAYGPSLHEIDLYPYSIINLSANINLRQLWFHDVILWRSDWVLTVLSQLTSIHLHTITLYLPWENINSKAFNWRAFAQILANSPFRTQLKLVQIFYHRDLDVVQPVRKGLADHLPDDIEYSVDTYPPKGDVMFGVTIHEHLFDRSDQQIKYKTCRRR